MTGFNKIYLGLLLVLLDFRIQGVDILPDFIGYIIVFNGLGQMLDWNPHYEQARRYVPFLVILSFLDIYQVQHPVGLFNFSPGTVLIVFLGVIAAALDLFVIFHVCTGIKEMAVAAGDMDLNLKAETRWSYYLYSKIAIAVSMLFLLIGPFLAIVIGIPLLVISIIVAILMLMLMKQADRTFQHFLSS
ncbi:MAG: hypothetical protein ACYCX4_02230 [Bacillota bacterium]